MNIENLINNLASTYDLTYHVYNELGRSRHPFAVRLEILYKNRVYSSLGVDESKDLSFFKALMELIERIALTHSSPISFKRHFFSSHCSLNSIADKYNLSTSLLVPENSNGVGLGLSQFRAQQSAKLELIERHTILTAILFGISPKIYKKLQPLLPKKFEYSSYFWKMSNYFTAVSAVTLPNGGYIFGYACSKNLDLAVKKSWFELVPNLLNSINRLDIETEVKSITKDDIASFNLYWKYSKDTRIFKFLNSESSKNYDSIPLIKNIFYSELAVPEEFNNLQVPLRCFRAISPEAQQLFFDNWDFKYINPNLGFKGPLPDFPHLIS